MTDKIVISMSSSGYCPKRLSAKLLDIPGANFQPDWLKLTAKEGNLHEDAMKADLITEGYQVEDSREDCPICKARYGSGRKGFHQEIELENFILVGHTDGNVKNYLAGYLLSLVECKSMSFKQFYRWMDGGFPEFPHYADQLTCYMQSTGLKTALYLVKNRNSGKVLKYPVYNHPSNFDEIIARLTNVVDRVLNKELVSAEYNPNKIECTDFCTIYKTCIPEIKINSADSLKLLSAVKTREELKEEISNLNDKVGSIEPIIKTYLEEAPFHKIRIGSYSLSLSKNLTKTTFTESRLQEAGVPLEQIAKARKESDPFDRLNIFNADTRKKRFGDD